MTNNNWKSREKVFSFLDDYSANLKDQIDLQRTKNPLLKSYIFETFDVSIYEMKNLNPQDTSIPNLFEIKDHDLQQIDEKLFCLLKNKETLGFIEEINERFSIYYSIDDADKSNKFVRNTLKNSSILDSLWISGKMYDEMLKKSSVDHPNRFTKIKFEFDSFFENKTKMLNKKTKALNLELDYEEHKVSSVSLVEELGDIVGKIEGVRPYFSSFNSIGLLRFPSLSGGGHDFYRNGKVTNRSNSFKDHRFQIKKTIDKYQKITESIEKKTWFDFEKLKSPDMQFSYQFDGSPVTITFNKPLKEPVYQNFVNYTFKKGREPFKIYGEVIRISENHHHVYGIDLHLWQKVMLDLSRERFILYIPVGTCGNTIHRIVTNIQRYLDPELNVYIGSVNYEEIIRTYIREDS